LQVADLILRGRLLIVLSFSLRPLPRPPLFPYTTLFRSPNAAPQKASLPLVAVACCSRQSRESGPPGKCARALREWLAGCTEEYRSEEHTSELQSRENLVCRLLLEKKNKRDIDETLARQQ